MSIQFKLVRFNPRRAARGAEAAEVEVTDDDYCSCLWMSRQDILENIAEFGEHPELSKAMQHYRTNEEYPAKANS